MAAHANHHRSSLTGASAGVIAVFINAIVFAAARVTSLTPFNSETLWSRSMVATPTTWTAGLLIELVAGALVGWAYSKIFGVLKRSGWDVGIGLGAMQWLVGGAVLGVFPGVGFYGSELGWPTFMLIFTSQILFGAIVGGLYVPDDQQKLGGSEKELDEIFEEKRAA